MKFVNTVLAVVIIVWVSSSCNNDDPNPDNSPPTWEHTFSEFGQSLTFPEIAQASDEGIILGANDFVFKLNKGGDMQWQTGLSGLVTSLIPVENDLYLLVGDSYDMEDEVPWLWCSLIDESGNIQWEKVYETDQGGYAHGYTAAQNGMDGFTIAGLCNYDFNASIPDQDQPKLWIINISDTGSIISENFLIADEIPKYSFDNVLIPKDLSGYIISADITSDTSYPILFKINNQGSLEWEKTFEPTYRSTQSIIESESGDYLFAGSTQIQAWIIRFTPGGDMVWEKYYGEGNRKHWAISIDEDENGFILNGFTNSKGAGLDDIWIFRINDDGDIMWDQTYGDTGYDSGSSIVRTFDSGYAAAGYTQVGEPSVFEIWVGKMDKNGQIE